MSMSTKPATLPPTSKKGVASLSSPNESRSQGQQFIVMALNMSWQLAVAVLLPLLGGVALDKAMDTHYVFTFIGLAVALLGMGAVLWRTLQTANRLPVPKLTEAQKREIQKKYEEDDD